MTFISLEYDQEKKYKFGCVVSCFERQDLAERSLRSISQSFLPDDLIFVLIDDGSKKELNLKLDHDHILIRKGKNYGISHSLSLGWDILHAMGVEYMTNLDSDAVVSKNWLSRLFYTSKCSGEKSIATGFNGMYHKEKYAVKNKYVVKESMGGINLFFRKSMYETVRKSLTTCESVPSSIEEATGLMEVYGKNPKLHKELNGWDWGLVSLCSDSNITTACCSPSVVQHIGIRGMTSSPRFYETARDFQNVCVPKIIHQMWKDNNVPDHLKAMQSSVIDKNPDYKYMFWTDDDIKKFICSEYVELAALYESFPYVIQKVDFARLLVLYHFGGIYIDLDSMCYGRLDDILRFPTSFVNTKKHQGFSEYYPLILNNAFMSAEKNNDFVKSIILKIITYEDPPDYKKYSTFNPEYTKALRSAGPLAVTETYMDYECKSLVNLLGENYYHGVSIETKNVDKMIEEAKSIHKSIKGCKLLHLHESSWWRANGKAILPPKNKSHRVPPDWYKEKLKTKWV